MKYNELDREWEFLEAEHESGLLTKKLKRIAGKQILIGIDDERTLHVLVEQDNDSSKTESLEIMDGLRIQSLDKLIENKSKRY